MAIRPYVDTFTVSIEETELLPPEPGYTVRLSRKTGVTIHYTVEVQIDIDGIVDRLGKKACGNKTGRSRDGFVTVKRVGKPKRFSPIPR